MKFSNTVFTLILLVCLSYTSHAGDIKYDKELFDKVSSKIDKDGSYFNFQSNKYLFRAFENSYLQVPEAIKAIIPKQEERIIPFKIYNCLKPIVKQLGIDEMLVSAASSVLIEENPPLFRSRQFIYYGDKKPDGIIWDVLAGENHELDSLKGLPKETLFACSSEFDPAKIWTKLKIIFVKIPFPSVQTIPQMTEQEFFKKFNVKLPELLSSLSGTYSSILMSARSVNDEPALYAMVKIPNKNNTTFKILAQLAKSQAYLQVLPDEIKPTTPPSFTWLKPLVRSENDNLYIVSNIKILNIIKETREKQNGLITSPEFKRLSQNMPANGIAFYYFNSKTIKVIIDIVKANAPTNDRDWSVLAKLIPPSDLFLVISKEEDGIMATMNSPMDIPLLITYTSVMPSIVQVAKVLPILGRGSSQRETQRAGCTANLKQLGLALKLYAMDHKDKYPTGNNTTGLNKLIKEDYLTDMAFFVCPNSKTVKATGKVLKEANSSYIYIGDFTEGDGPKIPLIFDKLNNKKGVTNILYQAGNVKSILRNFKNYEELINYLDKYSKFKPAILKKLQKKAKQIDKELGNF